MEMKSKRYITRSQLIRLYPILLVIGAILGAPLLSGD
ncbi:MAG: hypothetical protein ACI8XO_004810, partial [Verrucomicrobiales bacterium]